MGKLLPGLSKLRKLWKIDKADNVFGQKVIYLPADLKKRNTSLE